MIASEIVEPATRETLGEVSFREALAVWARIGVLSFGGPTAQIALTHRTIVDEKKWLDEPHFLSALSFCMLLPGPEAMQLATYVGWWLHGLKGALVAGLLFVLPGAVVVLALSMVYAAFGNVPVVEAVFFGIKAAVLVIVIEALLRIAKRALNLREHWIIAALSFVSIFFLGAPFPLIVFAAALFGYLRVTGTSIPRQSALFSGLVSTKQTLRLWIMAGAPYIEWITKQPRLKGALAAITAAVVGVILNLAIWFALHVFFAKVTLIEIGPLKLWTPALSSLNWRVVALSALSGLLLLKQHWSIPSVLGAASTLALIIRFLGI